MSFNIPFYCLEKSFFVTVCQQTLSFSVRRGTSQPDSEIKSTSDFQTTHTAAKSKPDGRITETHFERATTFWGSIKSGAHNTFLDSLMKKYSRSLAEFVWAQEMYSVDGDVRYLLNNTDCGILNNKTFAKGIWRVNEFSWHMTQSYLRFCDEVGGYIVVHEDGCIQ